MSLLSARQTLRFFLKNGLLVAALFFCLFPLVRLYQIYKTPSGFSDSPANLQSAADSLQAVVQRMHLFPQEQNRLMPAFRRLTQRFRELGQDSSLSGLNADFVSLLENGERRQAFVLWQQSIEPVLTRAQLNMEQKHRENLRRAFNRKITIYLFIMTTAGLLLLIVTGYYFRTKKSLNGDPKAEQSETDNHQTSFSFDQTALSRLTHDMKSPLGSIKQANLLLEKSLGENIPPEQKRFLDIIRANQKKLSDLVHKILSAAQSENEFQKLDLKEINLIKLLTGLLIFMSPAFRQKQIRVRIDFAQKKVVLRLDEEKIREVFENLLSNAIKFSRENSEITVSLKISEQTVEVSIRDQGIGIPENEQKHIFSKLFRASNAREISVKGSGLGLFIVRNLVRAHQGSVTVKSSPGEGSTFTVHLPYTVE